jgi:hypothetical protein
MQDLNDMLFFAEVAERGGFAAAGRALGLPTSRCRAGSPNWKGAWVCGCSSAPPDGSP